LEDDIKTNLEKYVLTMWTGYNCLGSGWNRRNVVSAVMKLVFYYKKD